MPLPRVQSLTDSELRAHLQTVCYTLAGEHFRKHNPDADPDQADTFAQRHWREFRETALDFLALAEADREAREAAPYN